MAYNRTSYSMGDEKEMTDRKPIVLNGSEELQFLEEFCKQNDYILNPLTVITTEARIEYPMCLLPVEMVE